MGIYSNRGHYFIKRKVSMPMEDYNPFYGHKLIFISIEYQKQKNLIQSINYANIPN